MEYRERLREVIKKLYGLEAHYVLTVPVTETHDGQTVWNGKVEVFNTRTSQAQDCYAWSYLDDDNVEQFTAVLGIPPVVSVQTVVRAAIVAQVKNERKET